MRLVRLDTIVIQALWLCRGGGNTMDSEMYLSNKSPNEGKSCIMENKIQSEPDYDLQIIIPVYNEEKYLRECLESVIGQITEYKILVVIIDDGSTDSSTLIINEYERNRNIKVIHQENRGFSGARNAGLSVVNARYVAFVDSDDTLLPGALDVMLYQMYKHDCDLLVANYVDSDGREGKQMRDEDDVRYTEIHGYPWAKIYRAELFREVGFPEGYWYEDTVLNMVLCQKCKRISTIPNVVYCYRKNPMGITSKSRGKNKTLDSFYITRQLLADRATLGIHEDDYVFIRMLMSQVKVNFGRIHSLYDLNVDKAVFLQTVQLLDVYLKREALEQYGKDSSLCKSLLYNKFWQYYVCCLLKR